MKPCYVFEGGVRTDSIAGNGTCSYLTSEGLFSTSCFFPNNGYICETAGKRNQSNV